MEGPGNGSGQSIRGSALKPALPAMGGLGRGVRTKKPRLSATTGVWGNVPSGTLAVVNLLQPLEKTSHTVRATFNLDLFLVA